MGADAGPTETPSDVPYDAPAAPDAPTTPVADSPPDAATHDEPTSVNELTVVAHDPQRTGSEVQRNETPAKYKWTNDEQKLMVIAAIESGKSAREASTEAGCSIATTFRILAQSENHLRC